MRYIKENISIPRKRISRHITRNQVACVSIHGGRGILYGAKV